MGFKVHDIKEARLINGGGGGGGGGKIEKHENRAVVCWAKLMSNFEIANFFHETLFIKFEKKIEKKLKKI